MLSVVIQESGQDDAAYQTLEAKRPRLSDKESTKQWKYKTVKTLDQIHRSYDHEQNVIVSILSVVIQESGQDDAAYQQSALA